VTFPLYPRKQTSPKATGISALSAKSGQPHKEQFVRDGATHMTLTRRFMRQIGRKGAQAHIDNSTEEGERPAQLSFHALGGSAPFI